MNMFRGYLRVALALGFVGHVYNMTGRWGANGGPKKSDAAFWASEKLIAEHGYHMCPSCGWATKDKGEHIARGIGNWCYDEAFNQKHGKYPTDDVDGVPAHALVPHNDDLVNYGYDHRVPWDKQPDGASALAALPDRMHHKMFRQ